MVKVTKNRDAELSKLTITHLKDAIKRIQNKTFKGVICVTFYKEGGITYSQGDTLILQQSLYNLMEGIKTHLINNGVGGQLPPNKFGGL